MAGTNRAFARDNASVASGVAKADIETPHVLEVMLADKVLEAFVKEYGSTTFWNTIPGKYGVTYKHIIASNNSLIADKGVVAGLSAEEQAHVKKLDPQEEGKDLDLGQLVLFTGPPGTSLPQKLSFRLQTEPALDSKVYLVLRTKGLPGEKVKVKLMQGQAQGITTVDSPIKVMHKDAATAEVKLTVGEFYKDLCASDKDNLIANKEEFKDHAVAELHFKNFGKEDGLTTSYGESIRSGSDYFTRLYLKVDAHSEHSKNIDPSLVLYYGGPDHNSAEWGNGDGNETSLGWIKLRDPYWWDPVRNPQKLQFNSYGEDKPASAAFGWVRNEGAKDHQGVDIFAPIGEALFASLDGTVHDLDPRTDATKAGKFVVIKVRDIELLKKARHAGYAMEHKDLFGPGKGEHEHGPDYSSEGDQYLLYAHLDTIDVKKGQVIRAGQKIGTAGMTGNAPVDIHKNRHLHFEIRDAYPAGSDLTNRTNPAFYINWAPVDKKKQEDNKDASSPT